MISILVAKFVIESIYIIKNKDLKKSILELKKARRNIKGLLNCLYNLINNSKNKFLLYLNMLIELLNICISKYLIR